MTQQIYEIWWPLYTDLKLKTNKNDNRYSNTNIWKKLETQADLNVCVCVCARAGTCIYGMFGFWVQPCVYFLLADVSSPVLRTFSWRWTVLSFWNRPRTMYIHTYTHLIPKHRCVCVCTTDTYNRSYIFWSPDQDHLKEGDPLPTFKYNTYFSVLSLLYATS